MTKKLLRVADEFLRLSKRNDIEITGLKLVKLVYLAHCHSLGEKNEPLFLNDICAWPYGPNIPDLYKEIKHHGRDPIPFSDIDLEKPSKLDEGTADFLSHIFTVYGDLDGLRLSGLVTGKNSPWKIKKRDMSKIFSKLEKGVKIPDSIIRDSYDRATPEIRVAHDRATLEMAELTPVPPKRFA